MWLGPAPMKPFTASRCNPPGTYWIYDYSIGYLGGWGAHPLDIMVWGSEADLSGPIVLEGTGEIPTEGLYDTVYNWDMQGTLGKVELHLQARRRFDQVHRHAKAGSGSGAAASTPNRNRCCNCSSVPTMCTLQVSPRQDQNFVDAIKSRQQPVSPITDAVRSDVISLLSDIAVRTKRKITWDWKAGEDRRRRRSRQAGQGPPDARAVDAVRPPAGNKLPAWECLRVPLLGFASSVASPRDTANGGVPRVGCFLRAA